MASWSEIINWVLIMRETWFWYQTEGFGYGESFWTIFRNLILIWRWKTGWRGCRRPRTTSRSEILTWGLTQIWSMLETWFSCQNQCFVVWGIILDHFQEPHIDLKVKKRVEDWRGCKRLRTTYICESEHARDLILVSNPGFLVWEIWAKSEN